MKRFLLILLLAVSAGATSTVMGVDWVGQKPAQHPWNGICYDTTLKKWCMVAQDGACAVSTDAKSWTYGTITGATWPFAIASHTGLFVEVGYDGKIYTSTDGLNWTLRYTSTPPFLISNVVWGDTLFVATCTGVTTDATKPKDILSSPDGITWSDNVLPDSSRELAICFGNHRWFTSAIDDGKIYTETNGRTWTLSTATFSHGIAACVYGTDNHGRGVWVGVSGNWPLYNYTGLAAGWTQASMPALSHVPGMDGIAYGNGLFVAVAYTAVYDSTRNIFTSPDGVNWTKRKSTISDTLQPLANVAYGNGKFVAVSPGWCNKASGGCDPMTLLNGDNNLVFTSENTHTPLTTAVYEQPFYFSPSFLHTTDSITVPINLSKITDSTFWANINPGTDTNIAILDNSGATILKFCDSVNSTTKKGVVNIPIKLDTTIPNYYYIDVGKLVSNYDSSHSFLSKCADRFSFDEANGKAINTIRAYNFGSVGTTTRQSSRLGRGAVLAGTNFFTDSTHHILNYDYTQKWSFRQVYKQNLPMPSNSGVFTEYDGWPGIVAYIGATNLFLTYVGPTSDVFSCNTPWNKTDSVAYHVMTINSNGTWGGISFYFDGVLSAASVTANDAAGSILNSHLLSLGNVSIFSPQVEVVDELQIYTDTLPANQISTWSNLVLNDTAISFGTPYAVNASSGGNGGLVGGLIIGVGIGIGFAFWRRKK